MIKEKRKILLLTLIISCIVVLLFLPLLAGAGSLDPPPEAVDGGGNPIPTMKTLDEIPPTWSQVLLSTDGEADGCNSSRFKCVLGPTAVLDLETGLVWKKNWSSNTVDWETAFWVCTGQGSINGRKGYRLPTVEELSSLTYNSGSPRLPPGNPFLNVANAGYWTSTTTATNPDQAYSVHFGNGNIEWRYKTNNFFVTCVRGGNH